MLELNKVYQGNCKDVLKSVEDNSIDAIVTDPPYGYSFMNKDWDKAVVSVDIWNECFRVLKWGAFAAVMSSPRQDVLSRMICNLQDAGFRTDFTSIYWTYASGFPKAVNVSKLVDKRNGRVFDTSVKDYLNQKRQEKGLSFNQINSRLGTATNGGGVASALMGDKQFNELPTLEVYNQLKTILDLDDRFDELIEREEAEREVIGKGKAGLGKCRPWGDGGYNKDYDVTKSSTEKAKELDGSYAGFQPKPAVEVILIVMKPLSEKSYVDQALSNSKGVTWLDDCRIPFQDNDRPNTRSAQEFDYTYISKQSGEGGIKEVDYEANQQGRFPPNLLVCDDVLNDGTVRKSGKMGAQTTRKNLEGYSGLMPPQTLNETIGDSGSYSRFFDLDKWFDTTFPFLAVPKASSSEKNKGLDAFMPKHAPKGNYEGRNMSNDKNHLGGMQGSYQKNFHPTVKPVKLMSWLVTLLTRPNDIVLDPFCGSGTTFLAAKMLKRNWIGIEKEKEYVQIAEARLKAGQ